MQRFKQKISAVITGLAAVTLLVVPLVSSSVAHAADNPKGTCFVSDPKGSKKPRACNAQDKKDIKKYSSNPKLTFNAKKCYSISSSTSGSHAAETDCSGKGTAGAQTCADGSTVDNVSDCPSGADLNSSDAAADPDADCGTVDKCDLLSTYINPFVNFLAALVGVAVTISIVVGGIRYASSAGDPQAAAAGKLRIRNSIIALVTFIFLYALLNFLIPGGLL